MRKKFKKINENIPKLSMYLCFIFAGTLVISLIFGGISMTRLGKTIDEREHLEKLPREAKIARNIVPILFLVPQLMGFIISIMAGFSLHKLIEKKDKKKIKKYIYDNIFNEEENKVIETIHKAGEKIKQNELVLESGLSKVKIHRIVKKLTEKNVLKKSAYGMTNMLELIEDN